MYDSEIWPLTKNREYWIAVFEKKALRSILRGVTENGLWQRCFNSEIYGIFIEPDIIKNSKDKIMNWASHVAKLNEKNPVKKVFTAKPIINRKR